MRTKHPEVPWSDPQFDDNQRNFPQEELDKYAGQHIAWSWDGSRILAGAADEEELYRKLQAAGFDTNRVVYDYVEVL
jgi:hypothetical protein